MTRLSRQLGAIAVLCLLVGGLTAGCGGGGATGSSADASPTNGGVLRVALESTPKSLDPSQLIERSAGIVAQQFAEGLFALGTDGEPEPNIASGYETSADGRTVTIDLRHGVTFSTGGEVTSKDVAFTIEKVKASAFNGNLLEAVTKVSAPSPYTVVLKLSSAAPGLIGSFATYAAYIVPDKYAGMSEHEFSETPIGTGPYEVSSGERGNQIKLVPNRHYWKQTKPHLDEIVFTVSTDESSRLQQVRSGDVDVVPTTPIGAHTGVPPNSGVRVEETPQRVVNYLLLNQDDPHFEDSRVREAVNLAIDRKGVVATATYGKGQPGASFLPPAELFYDDAKPPTPDVKKATQLIRQAEEADEAVTSPFTIRYYDFDAYSQLASQVLQQDLEEIGLSVKLQPLDESALNEMLAAGEYEAVLGLYSPAVTDPFGIVSLYLSFFAPGSGQDVAALTKVADEAATEMNEEKRTDLYAELQQMLLEEEGLLVVNYQPELYAVAEQVTGVEFDGAGNLLLHNAAFTE